MIREIKIENYKSISDLVLHLGRVTVLIGANGSGKSNILEAVVVASAAAQNKLDNEFLVSRGVRVTDTQFMRSAFAKASKTRDTNHLTVERSKRNHSTDNGIKISVQGDNELTFRCELLPDETASYPKWKQNRFLVVREVLARLENMRYPTDTRLTAELLERIYSVESGALPTFLVFAPENSALRTFQTEGQIFPLGIRGEGLFAHLKGLSSEKFNDRGRLATIKERLSLIDWYESFDLPENLSPGERSIRIRDRYLPEDSLFDQRSANEGFLFLLFYFTLFISPDTPAFFSIDNIDTSLNPKLCSNLLKQIVSLTKEFNKQVILTTHNPAILDGLNLHDEEQRLIVVDRNKVGHTRIRRVEAPKPTLNGQPVSLSEAFMRGYIGGLPKSF